MAKPADQAFRAGKVSRASLRPLARCKPRSGIAANYNLLGPDRVSGVKMYVVLENDTWEIRCAEDGLNRVGPVVAYLRQSLP